MHAPLVPVMWLTWSECKAALGNHNIQEPCDWHKIQSCVYRYALAEATCIWSKQTPGSCVILVWDPHMTVVLLKHKKLTQKNAVGMLAPFDSIDSSSSTVLVWQLCASNCSAVEPRCIAHMNLAVKVKESVFVLMHS